MTITPTEYKHIQLDDRNSPFIANTRMKVVSLVEAVKAEGWSPEELADQFPHLTLGQIHSAFAYYWDHKEEIDAEIERRAQEAERMRLEAGESPVAERLRGQGLLK
jgi:uncharacterized protein (DUF433 family)